MSQRPGPESNLQTINAPQAGTFLLGMVLIATSFLMLFLSMFSASVGNSSNPHMRELGSTSLAIGMPILIVTTIAMRLRRHRLLCLVSTMSWLAMAAIALVIVLDSGYAIATIAVLWILFIGALSLVVQALEYLRPNRPLPPARRSPPRSRIEATPASPAFPPMSVDPAYSLQDRVDAESSRDNGKADADWWDDQRGSGGNDGGQGSDPLSTPDSNESSGDWGFNGGDSAGSSGGDSGGSSGGDSGGSSGGDSGSSSST